MPMTLVDSRHVICPQLGARSAPAPAPTKVWELGDTPCRMKARFRRNFAASQRLVHFSGGGIKVAKRGRAQCAHLGLRIRLYRHRTGPHCGCFWGSGGFSRVGARFESHRGHVLSLFRGF